MFHNQVEGTGFLEFDKRFRKLFAGHVRIERLWTGARWCEGPAWFAAGRYLVWSDIPNNRMMRLVEPSHEVSVFREASNHSNGNTVDRLRPAHHLRAPDAARHHDPPRRPHRHAGRAPIRASGSTRPTTRW